MAQAAANDNLSGRYNSAMTSRRRGMLIAFAIVVAFLAAFVLTPPRGTRSMRQFNAERLARLETRMWQAYYAKQNARLFGLLVTMLHEQYHYSWARAATEAFHLARAAATFGNMKHGDGVRYEVVLPDLEKAYAAAKSWTGAAFDPREVARAELAWWVARRIPGQNSAEQVGRLIAEEYGLLYETSPMAVADAAFLRAQAAALRDAQAKSPDWDRIAALLLQSYRELSTALATASV